MQIEGSISPPLSSPFLPSFARSSNPLAGDCTPLGGRPHTHAGTVALLISDPQSALSDGRVAESKRSKISNIVDVPRRPSRFPRRLLHQSGAERPHATVLAPVSRHGHLQAQPHDRPRTTSNDRSIPYLTLHRSKWHLHLHHFRHTRKIPSASVASEELSEAQLVIGGTVVCIVFTILVFYFIHFKQTYQRKMKEMPQSMSRENLSREHLSREQVA
ncbi:hypothetical protein PRIPAC_94629 [Pristionchus pacificus]|uniref:Uncharacterized protein n=1 Tax=Pristionchus pacificus TaxID=54126 RepID=A0A2A6CHJ4_PRIPA|nr:hypothetical protein PRIPAC_94629 [Pristionchus pacificus]|eukprot:PDM77491.1 hypothetical protein PRIPAC_34358 [Pristionchus pacificus]